MFDLPGPLGTFANFLVIAAGFGFIIFIHELGHFLAAKWAGIRVLAFSIGFGQVACSYRKGMGFRIGSSEPEYRKRAYGLNAEQAQELHKEVSPTEYRLSWLPLGGYVKMLGQEDLNPDAVSEEPDSYQNCSVFKRMVVISAGVIMNVISAAILFIIVFNAGLKVFPAKVGYVAPDGPAAMATPIGRDDIQAGLERGDRITEINGKRMYSFEHIMPEIAMARKGVPVSLVVERDGIEGPITFEAVPVKNPMTGLLGIQIDPPISTSVHEAKTDEEQRRVSMLAGGAGVPQLQAQDTLARIAARSVRSPLDLLDAAEESGGEPFEIQINRNGALISSSVAPVRELQQGAITMDGGLAGIEHVLGLHGVMMVNPHASVADTKQGLKPGDIFARVGSAEFPSVAEGIEIVQRNAGKALSLAVLRQQADGNYERVELDVNVTGQGTIGFYPVTSTAYAPFVHKPIRIAAFDERVISRIRTTTPSPSRRPRTRSWITRALASSQSLGSRSRIYARLLTRSSSTRVNRLTLGRSRSSCPSRSSCRSPRNRTDRSRRQRSSGSSHAQISSSSASSAGPCPAARRWPSSSSRSRSSIAQAAPVKQFNAASRNHGAS